MQEPIPDFSEVCTNYTKLDPALCSLDLFADLNSCSLLLYYFQPPYFPDNLEPIPDLS